MNIQQSLWKKGNNFNKKQTVTKLALLCPFKPSHLSVEIAQYDASWPVMRETRDRYQVNSFTYLSNPLPVTFSFCITIFIDDYYVSFKNNPLHSNRFLSIFLKPTVFHQPLYCVIIVITSQRVFLKFNRRLYLS